MVLQYRLPIRSMVLNTVLWRVRPYEVDLEMNVEIYGSLVCLLWFRWVDYMMFGLCGILGNKI